jgi:hypothetical protein
MLLSNSAKEIFLGVADGTRTHDDQNHNLGLYQLSYSHRRASDCSVKKQRFEDLKEKGEVESHISPQ